MPVTTAQLGLSNCSSSVCQLAPATRYIRPSLSLLLVDGSPQPLACHEMMLSNSGYRVIRATTLSEIFGLRRMAIQLVVLSDSLGSSVLRGAAENVRRTWPAARILVLGAAQCVLADQLYDEAVDSQIDSQDLLAILGRLSRHPISCSAQKMGSKVDFAEFNPSSGPEQWPTASESDPDKLAESESVPKDGHRDLPAEEREN